MLREHVDKLAAEVDDAKKCMRHVADALRGYYAGTLDRDSHPVAARLRTLAEVLRIDGCCGTPRECTECSLTCLLDDRVAWARSLEDDDFKTLETIIRSCVTFIDQASIMMLRENLEQLKAERKALQMTSRELIKVQGSVHVARMNAMRSAPASPASELAQRPRRGKQPRVRSKL